MVMDFLAHMSLTGAQLITFIYIIMSVSHSDEFNYETFQTENVGSCFIEQINYGAIGWKL